MERAFDVVEYLLEVETATLTEVADTLDIAKSTAHRHLGTLEHRGYVIRRYEAFTLGMRFLDHGYFLRRRAPQTVSPVRRWRRWRPRLTSEHSSSSRRRHCSASV
ncbi:MAG: helix-turn-helix domain-containing protein [Halolamina sp.]|uniref:helix-turn-helix domain-containing protein n=1 Tax=Halolamina sp. TaxID=1940283 RepID=UPI002FC37E4A